MNATEKSPALTEEQTRLLGAANARLQRSSQLYIKQRHDYRSAMAACHEAVEILKRGGLAADPRGARLIGKAENIYRAAQQALSGRKAGGAS